MNSAIVTDVHYRMSLAAVRALGKNRIPVAAVEYTNIPFKAALGFYSRYATYKHLIMNPVKDESGFLDSMIKLASEVNSNRSANGKPVLIPVGLDTLMAVIKYKEELEPHLHFIASSAESLDTANDTEKLLNTAVKAGIPCPETTTLEEGETIEQLSARIRYPAVIKYRKGELLKFKPDKRYKIIDSASAFVDAFTEMHGIQPFPLVQQYISGDGYGVSAVFDKNSEPLEIFCHRRLREYPATGGPSCFCESIWDDRLVTYAVQLLKALKWKGIAMVEFKGRLDGEIALMEVNPRFWGSMPLSILSGCNIPYALYRASMGEIATVDEALYKWHPGRYRLGKRMRYLLQDILSVPGYMRLKKNRFSFLAGFAADLLNPFISDGVLELKDWRPSLAYITQAIKKLG